MKEDNNDVRDCIEVVAGYGTRFNRYMTNALHAHGR
jgi:hypothetical protein